MYQGWPHSHFLIIRIIIYIYVICRWAGFKHIIISLVIIRSIHIFIIILCLGGIIIIIVLFVTICSLAIIINLWMKKFHPQIRVLFNSFYEYHEIIIGLSWYQYVQIIHIPPIEGLTNHTILLIPSGGPFKIQFLWGNHISLIVLIIK